MSFAGVLVIFLVLLVGRKAGAGYSLVTAFVIFVSSVPSGIPFVTTTVLAVGARQMAKEKAIVARWVLFVMLLSGIMAMYDHGSVSFNHQNVSFVVTARLASHIVLYAYCKAGHCHLA